MKIVGLTVFPRIILFYNMAFCRGCLCPMQIIGRMSKMKTASTTSFYNESNEDQELPRIDKNPLENLTSHICWTNLYPDLLLSCLPFRNAVLVIIV